MAKSKDLKAGTESIRQEAIQRLNDKEDKAANKEKVYDMPKGDKMNPEQHPEMYKEKTELYDDGEYEENLVPYTTYELRKDREPYKGKTPRRQRKAEAKTKKHRQMIESKPSFKGKKTDFSPDAMADRSLKNQAKMDMKREAKREAAKMKSADRLKDEMRNKKRRVMKDAMKSK